MAVHDMKFSELIYSDGSQAGEPYRSTLKNVETNYYVLSKHYTMDNSVLGEHNTLETGSLNVLMLQARKLSAFLCPLEKNVLSYWNIKAIKSD
jgi:hypothetical protein